MGEQDAGLPIVCDNCGAPLPEPADLEMLATEVDMALGIEFKRPVQRAEWAGGPPDGLLANLLPWLANTKERRAIWQRGQDLWAERVMANQPPPCPSCSGSQVSDEARAVAEPEPTVDASRSTAWPAAAPEPEASTVHLSPSVLPVAGPEPMPSQTPVAQQAGVEEHESKTIVSPIVPLDRQGPRLVVITGPVRGYEFSLTRAVTSLGRSVACQITVDDPDVAPQHALILRRDDRWRIQDASGSAKTLVNDRPVVDNQELNAGDVIQVGSARLRFVEPRAGAQGAVS